MLPIISTPTKKTALVTTINYNQVKKNLLFNQYKGSAAEKKNPS